VVLFGAMIAHQLFYSVEANKVANVGGGSQGKGGECREAPPPSALATPPAPAPAPAPPPASSPPAAAPSPPPAEPAAPPAVPQEESNNALLKACKDSDLPAAAAALAAGADLNATFSWGSSPLIMACQYGAAEVALLLVEKGADVKRTNEMGVGGLTLACAEGMAEVVKAVLEKGQGGRNGFWWKEEVRACAALGRQARGVRHVRVHLAHVRACSRGRVRRVLRAGGQPSEARERSSPLPPQTGIFFVFAGRAHGGGGSGGLPPTTPTLPASAAASRSVRQRPLQKPRPRAPR
jgi:hypothetical protein